jgi:hypothetical protein
MFGLTRKEIMRLPKDQRAPWLDMLERQKQREKLVAELVKQGDFAKALCLYGSEERAKQLVSWSDRLTDDQVRELLTDFWSMTEAWSGVPKLREGMLGLLRRATILEPLIVQDETNEVKLPLLMKVYRGNMGENPREGHSWTLDFDVAKRFAILPTTMRGKFLGMERDGTPTVWVGKVRSSLILGFFNDKGEKEVVVEPETLEVVEIIAEGQPYRKARLRKKEKR